MVLRCGGSTTSSIKAGSETAAHVCWLFTGVYRQVEAVFTGQQGLLGTNMGRSTIGG